MHWHYPSQVLSQYCAHVVLPSSTCQECSAFAFSGHKVIMVENSLDAIRYHLENGVHISSFYGDRGDTELLSTLESLKDLALEDDVRDGIIRYVILS